MPENDQQDELMRASREVELRMQTGLSHAVEAIAGNADADPFAIFPDPSAKERRADVEFPTELTPDQELAFRSAMVELGIGRTTNRGAEEVGLSEGYTALMEGGQGHKMVAELNLIMDSETLPGQLIISGDSGRKLPEAERGVTAGVLGIEEGVVGETEADVAAQVLTLHKDFQPEEPQVLPIGYTQNGEITTEVTGQFVRIGSIRGIPAIVMRIDRELNNPEDATQGFRRPDNKTKMYIVSQVEGVGEIGFATSSTYQPSIEVDAVRAGKMGARVKVPTYGTHELARVKSEEPAEPTVSQLAAEAFKTAKQLQSLREEMSL